MKLANVNDLASYRNFHLWMLIPFAISVAGFSMSYYSRLASVTFHQHVHGLSATLWYVLIIVQPYLIARKKSVKQHVLLGVFGLMLAGIVAGSAYTIIPKNIDNVTELDVNGFFPPAFAYFATLIDFLLITMFAVSVVLSVIAIKRKQMANHVQWLMASVFFVLSPALARMLAIGYIVANQGNMDGISLVILSVPSMIIMILIIVFYYYKYGSFKHPSFALLMIAHVPYMFVEAIGNNEVFRSIMTAIFKS